MKRWVIASLLLIFYFIVKMRGLNKRFKLNNKRFPSYFRIAIPCWVIRRNLFSIQNWQRVSHFIIKQVKLIFYFPTSFFQLVSDSNFPISRINWLKSCRLILLYNPEFTIHRRYKGKDIYNNYLDIKHKDKKYIVGYLSNLGVVQYRCSVLFCGFIW